MDFTFKIYEHLLISLQERGYAFQAFEDFIKRPEIRSVVLRHDIDKLPGNALRMAQLESELAIRGSYYFRVVRGVWNESIIGRVAALGHEIGYHYEDLTIFNGNHAKAFRHFEEQLKRFRRICPVKTICMHGSPLSRYDNRDLWAHNSYRDHGIIGEPYFDADFSQVFYVTDTGRMWNNTGASIRDRVASGFDIPIKSTSHLIELTEQNMLPNQIMINAHPQRWHDSLLPWVKELVGQKVKNVLKKGLLRARWH